jgi:peptidoglycan biosynthesis protein MviN/MurJ (putative lipid II flippase)
VVKISWVSLGVNILGCIVLMRFMQHAGIALASSIAVLVQLAIQHGYIARTGVRLSADHRSRVGKMLAASLIMGGVLIPLSRMDVWAQGLTLYSASVLVAGVALGIVLYLDSCGRWGFAGACRSYPPVSFSGLNSVLFHMTAQPKYGMKFISYKE